MMDVDLMASKILQARADKKRKLDRFDFSHFTKYGLDIETELIKILTDEINKAGSMVGPLKILENP